MIVNGKKREDIPGGINVMEFLKHLKVREQFVVLEVNGEIVPKTKYFEYLINSGDNVEIVSFVGGG